MHTATRLALPVIARVRALNPRARLLAFGLYAPLNAALLRERGVDHIAGGEFEDELLALVCDAPVGVVGERSGQHGVGRPAVPRVTFRVPDRTGLPLLSRYATLQVGGERRMVGYTE